MSVMELGHLLTRSGLTYLEVSSEVWHDYLKIRNRYINILSQLSGTYFKKQDTF